MNILKVLSKGLIIILLLGYGNEVIAQWEALGQAGFSAGTAESVSIAVDQNGVPYVGYRDPANGDRATVMKFNDTTSAWEVVGTAGFSPELANDPDISISRDGTLYMVYGDYSISGNATVQKYDNVSSTWKTVGSAGFSGGPIGYPKIKISPDSTVYVVFKDYGNGKKVTVMALKDTVTGWQTVGQPGFSDGEISYPYIAIAADNTPYVSFTDEANGYKATVMKYDAVSLTWEVVGQRGFSIGAVGQAPLAISDSGLLYVAYANRSQTVSKLNVMKFVESTSSWESVGPENFSKGQVDWVSILVQDTIPYVAFSDYSNNLKTSAMKYNSITNEWQKVGYPGFSEGEADNVELVMQHKIPYVVYRDGAHNYGATVMKYIKPPLEVQDTVLTVDAIEGSTVWFYITSDTSWTVNSGQSWLSGNQISGLYDAVIFLTANSNPTTSERTAIVTVSAAGVQNPVEVEVTQNPGTTGVDDNMESNSFYLFPNPVNDKLKIGNLNKSTSILIYGTNGKLLLDRNLDSNNNIIDVSGLAKGIYIVKIIENHTARTCKIVKQ